VASLVDRPLDLSTKYLITREYMIHATQLLEELVKRDVALITGVPCSYLTPLINATLMDENVRYIPSSSEGEALATASGTWLAGRISIVMQQNSGLGNIVNPLTSLSAIFKIPSLLFVTWRGQPGRKDEPQHSLMGRITPSLLDLMGVPWAHLPSQEDNLSASLDRAFEHMRYQRTPYAFLIRKGDIVESSKDNHLLFHTALTHANLTIAYHLVQRL
jgi:phosphonopyruvate decarboxylase